MSAPVDVLAVMEAAAQSLAICCPEADDARHNEMVAARAAVAELIKEASRYYEWYGPEYGDKEMESALARVTGAQP